MMFLFGLGIGLIVGFVITCCLVAGTISELQMTIHEMERGDYNE